jgi:hypothetical protein
MAGVHYDPGEGGGGGEAPTSSWAVARWPSSGPHNSIPTLEKADCYLKLTTLKVAKVPKEA